MKDLKIIVLGDGFVAQAFKRKGYEVWGRDKFEWNEFDPIGSMAFLIGMIKTQTFDAVINTIGISDTRYCENDNNWDEINNINGLLPGFLSRQCWGQTRFVHISTGCLYDTKNIPQKEDAFKSAHCNYVVSKWLGELGCSKENDLIIRPRLIFDSVEPKAGTRNNLLCKLREFTSFLGEYNTVTSCDTIVEAIEALLDNDCVGVFNVGNTGEYTIADIAEACGFDVKEKIYEKDLHKSQGLYLVNNLMDMSKLQQYYEPCDVIDEVKSCWSILNKEGK